MKTPKPGISGLYLISDAACSRGRTHEEIVRAAVKGGARVIQLRDKTRTVGELYPIAVMLRDMTSRAGAVFIVNDSVELAMAAGADGVHLGQDDMPIEFARRLMGEGKIIGVSTHSLEQALAAEKEGADYIGFGPVFPTDTKDAGAPRGLEALRAVRGEIKIPIVAIGGINAGNAGSVMDAGADAVAVISAVSGAEDVEKAAREIVCHSERSRGICF